MKTPWFDTALIANRGEIACRVIATCQRLGIRTVAVYSQADAQARHVRLADIAIPIGPAAARESYLVIDKIIAAAKQSGAQAIHPGYGFLSENADFARACGAHGIVFIGPSASAIEAMGDKSAAKALMQKAGVPLTPGYHGDRQEPEFLHAQADAIGYPVLIKASAGGGGKGMRRVDRSDDFLTALASCQREAASAFGNDHVLVEKYVLRPRHIEIQVFGDTHGNVVYLNERDCSVQRRHQKVLEEAPAPGLSAERRAAMGQAAANAARAVNYVGAGTVEFIVSQDGEFYFMEMNTRLQVEHPVTEMITGQDLVEWQLRVAMGESLPCTQQELSINGHSFEARLYAEDPEQDFLPATGTLTRFHIDLEGAGLTPEQVRLDSGVESGDTVSMHYDPMLAKLIVHGPDRAAALATLNRALAALDVQGVVTNRAFLQRLATHPDFAAANFDTRFIERHEDTLFAPHSYTSEDYASAALIGLHQLARECESSSPWDRHDGFRLNAPRTIRIALCPITQGQGQNVPADAEFCVVEGQRVTGVNDWQLTIGDETLHATIRALEGDAVAITLNGHRRRVQARLVGERQRNVVVMVDPQRETRLYWNRIDSIDHGHHEAESTLTAPMHGTVVTLLQEPGVRVEKGMPLMVMEAMKMEHTINAPADGQVESFHFKAGDTVGQGDVLLEFAPEE